MRLRTHPLVTTHPSSTDQSIGVLRVLPDRNHRENGTFLGGAKVWPIRSDVQSIGRGLQNSVVLLDPAVSRCHAYLNHTDDGWVIENASQSSAILLNDSRLYYREHAFLQPGDSFTLGNTTLQMIAPAVRPDAIRTDSSASAEKSGANPLFAPGITLQFALSRDHGRYFWPLASLSLVFLFLLGSMITLGIMTLAGQNIIASTGAGRLVAAMAVPLIPVAGVALVVGMLDRYEREPWLLLGAAFLWGAVIALPSAVFIEPPVTRSLLHLVAGSGLFSAALAAIFKASVAAIVEEVFKGAGLVLLLVMVRDQFDNVTDGALYGMAIGAGFGMVENYLYFVLSAHVDIQALFAGRIALGWLAHSTFTGFVGAALGYMRERHQRTVLWWWMLAGLLAAIVLHTLFDATVFEVRVAQQFHLTPGGPMLFGVFALLAVYVPLFLAEAVLLGIVSRSLQRESGIVRQYLVGEVQAGSITPDEYVLVQDASLRGRAERRMLAIGGLRVYMRARALHQAVIGLAFRHWHVACGEPAKGGDAQPEDAYRARIRRLRAELATINYA